MSIQTITNEITAPITVARDAYQLALANGFIGTLTQWLNQQNTALGFAEAAEASATAAAISANEAADASRLEIGTVSTSAPGAGGSVTITGDPGEQVLDFVVPRGPQGEVGLTGATGAQGPQGDQGDRAGLKYSFDTNTSPGSPNHGHLKFNSSTLSAVTRISIRDTDFNGTDISALLALIDDSTSAIKARVVIRSNSNADTSHFNFLVTSVTDEGNHYHINGTYVSGSAFSNNEVVTFDFYATGDQGIQGIQGIGPVTIADAAPVSPTDGMLWMGTTTEILYLYSSAQSRWIIPYALDVDRELDSDDEFLSLNLQFSRDKTLIARRGPTPVFTRASTATFVGSNGLIQSAAVNEPRFDHDPLTLACKGLLIEEQRANLLLRSEDFGTSWSNDAGRVAVATNVIASPSGAITADKITENSVLLERRILIGTVTAVASTVYTYSCFLKAGERDFAQLAFGTTFGNQFQNFIIGGVNAGTLGSGSGVTSPQIIALPDGWYRCTATVTSAGSGVTQVTIGPADSSTLGKWGTYLGTVGSGIYAWGAQLEAGAFPTSYIPTTTAALTRSEDVCSITGSNFSGFYNQSEGTMFANAFTPASGDRTVLATDDDTANEMIRLRTEGTNPFFKVADGNSELVAIDAGTVVGNTAFKLIGAYKVNDFASSINGGSVVADNTGTIPTVDRMRIGAGQGGNTMCGHITSLRYYRKRLTNFKLQSLTS